MTEKVIIILGMHRSGTSCLAGSLEESGLFLGDISRVNPHNKKGNYENHQIMQLHENILRDNGGSWDNPPPFCIWDTSHKHKRDIIIENYATQRLWGFKDPRTILMMEGWLEVLKNVQLVGTVRHPVSVAASLSSRDKMLYEKSLELWAYYNQKLLAYYNQSPFPIVCFDLEAELYFQQLRRLFSLLHLPNSHSDMRCFDKQLRHNATNALNGKLPRRILRLYETLIKISYETLS